MTFVLDASMMMSWFFADELTPGRAALSRRTVAETIVVPPHWLAEVANAALVGERRGRATAAATARLREKIVDMVLDVDEVAALEPFTSVLPIARAHRLTVYDALYLELAERRGLPLATLDGDLAAAARSVGIEVLDGEEG